MGVLGHAIYHSIFESFLGHALLGHGSMWVPWQEIGQKKL
jgi:hypothetical protein